MRGLQSPLLPIASHWANRVNSTACPAPTGSWGFDPHLSWHFINKSHSLPRLILSGYEGKNPRPCLSPEKTREGLSQDCSAGQVRLEPRSSQLVQCQVLPLLLRATSSVASASPKICVLCQASSLLPLGGHHLQMATPGAVPPGVQDPRERGCVTLAHCHP